MDIALGEGMVTSKLFILRALPQGNHLSGPEFQLRVGDRSLAWARTRAGHAEGRKGAAQRTGWVLAAGLASGSCRSRRGLAAGRPAPQTAGYY